MSYRLRVSLNVQQVGTELGQVESLWSQFESVMAKNVQEQQEVKDRGSTVMASDTKDIER